MSLCLLAQGRAAPHPLNLQGAQTSREPRADGASERQLAPNQTNELKLSHTFDQPWIRSDGAAGKSTSFKTKSTVAVCFMLILLFPGPPLELCLFVRVPILSRPADAEAPTWQKETNAADIKASGFASACQDGRSYAPTSKTGGAAQEC